MARSLKLHGKIFIVAFALLLSLPGCQFRTPAAQTPVTNNSGELVPKSFFLGNGQTNALETSSQKFAASWAPIDEKGQLGEIFLMHGVPMTTHLNLRWKITEHALLAYEINPSFKSDVTSSHDVAIIEIPITRHYYYEREKDGYQRDTNRFIKNESRDAWMYRPYMDLDFKGLRVYSQDFAVLTRNPGSLNVDEFEWDQKNKYLAFTLEIKEDRARWDHAQGRVRFNFMAFEGAPGFQKTPYDESTAQHINVLHVLGRKIDGQTPVNYAGHWDLSKPITFYTYGVAPGSEHMAIIRDCVKEWNEGFVKAGLRAPGENAIVLNETPLAYPFDLRYPVINWISDKRRSLNAPLGIGEALADVSTGQILWGSLSIWSGIVEDYVNKFVSAESAYQAIGMGGHGEHDNLDAGALFDPKALSAQMRSPFGQGASMTDFLRSQGAVDQMKAAFQAEASKSIREMQATNPEMAKKMQESLASIQNNANQWAGDYLQHLETDLLTPTQFQVNLDRLSIFHSMFSATLFDAPAGMDEAPKASAMSHEQTQLLARDVMVDRLRARANAEAADFDRTFADVLPGWAAAHQGLNMQNVSEHEIVRSLLKNLVIHEMGHVLGLGHNFMGNILPEEGTISQDQRDQLKEQLRTKGYVATTVMDYYSPRTEVEMPYDDVKAGIYDVQMLRFLYKGEYPVIDKTGKNTKYYRVGEDGIIPTDVNVVPAGNSGQAGEAYHLAFLPSCNDLDASLNLNPLCQRFDRGPTAKEIMANRFKDFNSSLMSMLNAFSGAKGGDVEWREYSVWWRTLSEFSQIRIFYDYMRMMIDDNPQYQDAFATISRSQDALLAFSQACIDPNTAPGEDMKRAFAKLALKDPSKLGTPIGLLKVEDFTRVHDFCEANKIAMDQFTQILMRKGSDSNVMDRQKRFEFGGMTGGETDLGLDWSRVWGSYKEVGSFPIRFLALYTLTNPEPSFLGFYSIPLYANPQGRYSYASLYPSEFSTAIDTAVRQNLMYGGGALAEPTLMGSSLLYMDYLLWRNFVLTKDNSNRFPSVFVDNLKSMTTFDISLSPIILTNVAKPKLRDTLAFKYNAAYFDLGERDTIPIPYAYLLTDRRVIAKGIDKQILMPVTRFRYLTDKWGYVWALNLRYDDKRENPFKGTNVKYGLDQGGYQKQLENCVDGPAGLAAFFNDNNEDFDGFEVGTGLAVKKDLQNKFDDSVNFAFRKYYSKGVHGVIPDRNACDETVRGIGLSVCGAAIINGYTLPQCFEYLNF